MWSFAVIESFLDLIRHRRGSSTLIEDPSSTTILLIKSASALGQPLRDEQNDISEKEKEAVEVSAIHHLYIHGVFIFKCLNLYYHGLGILFVQELPFHRVFYRAVAALLEKLSRQTMLCCQMYGNWYLLISSRKETDGIPTASGLLYQSNRGCQLSTRTNVTILDFLLPGFIQKSRGLAMPWFLEQTKLSYYSFPAYAFPIEGRKSSLSQVRKEELFEQRSLNFNRQPLVYTTLSFFSIY